VITKAQALTANNFHVWGYSGDACTLHIGKRGGQTERVYNVRRNGATKTWKRSPERFRIPIKYGLYEYGEITEHNAQDFHVVEDCTLRKTFATDAMKVAYDMGVSDGKKNTEWLDRGMTWDNCPECNLAYDIGVNDGQGVK